MKKHLLAFSMTAFLLMGCQDEKPDEQTSAAPSEPQVEAPAPESASTTEAPTSVAPEPPAQEIEHDIDDAHYAQNSLDWPGSYSGIFPCADCEGLETELTLNQDGSYTLEQAYLGKGAEQYHSEGQFTWSSDGSVIILSNEAEPNQYFVAENELIKLDTQGQQITGELAEKYTLTKH